MFNRQWIWKRRSSSNENVRRKDNIYEETVRRSSRTLSTISSGHKMQRTESTVKLRRIQSSGRRVFVNLPLPEFALTSKGRAKETYASNKIRTSKYTIITFVPKNLFEQFRRPANLYFLGMAIIQLLPLFGVKSPALTLLPICAVVFITALKDAIEDYQRHKVDARYNQNITHTLIGYNNTNYPGTSAKSNPVASLFSCFSGHKLTKKESHDTINQESNHDVSITTDTSNAQSNHSDNLGTFHPSLAMNARVGDFILLRNGDSVPADAVLLSTSDKEGVCYVETKDLDGETNLKPRNSVAEFKHIQSGMDCLNECHFYVEADAPAPDLYKFDGTLVTLEKSESTDKWVEKNKTPLDINNILLRGHVIRNTKWAIAVVLFTGTDTKIILNSGDTPSKRSQIDTEMNKEIFVAFIVLFTLCLVCAIMAGVVRARDMGNSASLLFTAQSGSPGYVGFLNFWSSLIIFQNIIPISLYVSIEFVKTFQAYFIWNDLDMWDEHSKSPCIPKTWTLSDDLGQVEYIFSDKTGTLTRNIMEFRECTIGGVRYGDNGFSPESEGARGARLRKEKQNVQTASYEEGQSSYISAGRDDDGSPPLINTDQDPLQDGDEKKANEEHNTRKQRIFEEYEQILKGVFKPTYSSLDPNRLSFADPQLFKDIKNPDITGKLEADDKETEQSNRIKEFFMLLALCHTVVIEKIGKDGKVIEEEDDVDEEEETKAQPTIIGKSLEENADHDKTQAGTSQNIEKQTIGSSLRTSGSKLLNATGLRSLKKSNRRHRPRKSRGEEFDSITEKDTPDRVDDTVEVQIEYKAESPDEAALVNAAKNAGFAFINRKGKMLTVDILGQEYTFELLDVLGFTSDRKRMSVILKRPEPWNDIILYCKGADNVITERLDHDSEQQTILDKTHKDVDTFSENGLRTLMLAYRSIDNEEYASWKKEIDEASTATEGRAEKVAQVQEKIEVNLKLLGATGIEDKLQEGVPKCIEDLRKAGIKIWVLTGDKLETAINIGYASNLLDSEMQLWTVRGNENANEIIKNLGDISEKLDKIENEQGNDAPEDALVIEGAALAHVFGDPEARQRLLDIAVRCKSVICCRVSPLQKAQVVELVRKSHNVVTLAIGDGANDVSMIQVANVGVGIAGQEGVQAAMAADYSICQFRFLHKLLLVQGHWSYVRISEMILNFFFKNVFWVFPSLWYQIYSSWSGNIFYDYSFLQLYNIIFTLAPIVVLGATDQDITAPYLKHLPQVYTIGIERKLYTRFRFWLYFADGIWQSLVVFYSFYFLYDTNPNANGEPESNLQFSTSVAVTAIVLANLVPGFNTWYWTWLQFVFVTIELLVAFLWVVIYGSFPSVSLYGMAQMVFGSWSFWMTFIIAFTLAFLPRYAITFVYQWWYPNVVAKGRQFEL
ncbi:hypothetical protein RMCBS344292_08693 [Rhizopus microsporus]|nr:hypothetical protein RMCBS344292_08693 [Rhizopus microsporus]